MATKERAQRSMYRCVEIRVWNDEKFVALTERAKLLWLFLLTHPNTRAYPGLFSFSVSETAERFGWTTSETTRLLDEVTTRKMARHDANLRLLLLPNAIKSNPPASPNAAKAWGRALREFPVCALRKSAESNGFRYLRESCLGEAFPEAFRQGLGEGFAKGTGNQISKKEEDQEIPPKPPQGGAVPAAPRMTLTARPWYATGGER